MMIYQRRADTREATRIESPEHAAETIGGRLVRTNGVWTVVRDGLTFAGAVGDYLERAGTSWRVIPAATFEAQWMPATVDWLSEAEGADEALAQLGQLVQAVQDADSLVEVKLALHDFLLPPLRVIVRILVAIVRTYRRDSRAWAGGL